MTLDQLRQNLYRRLHFGDTPDTAVATRITMLLNQRHRALLTSPALRQLREGFTQFDSVASLAEYALPYGVSRITTIRETTNQRTLGVASWDWYRQRQPNPATELGTPDVWVPLGLRAVARRPAGTGVWVASSSAGDTTQIVTWHVSAADSTPRGAQVTGTTTLTGTTRVRLGTGLYDDVFTLSLSAAAAGLLTFFDAAAAGNTLVTMPIGRRTSRLSAFALSPTPAGVLTYSVDFEHALVDMANAWDEPLLPEDFHDLLVFAVLMDEYEYRDDNRYSSAEANYKKRLSDLKCSLYGHRAATQPRSASELGPLGSGAQAGWFPAQYS